MEPLDPGLVVDMRRQLALVRVIGLSLCFLAPAAYLSVLIFTVFHGSPRPLFAGFHAVPWGDLRIIALSMVSLALVAAGPFLVQQFRASAYAARTAEGLFANLRTGHIIHCALLEAVAIFGLVLGIMVGPAAGPVSLVMLLVPPAGYLLLVPGTRSRVRLLAMQASELPGGRQTGLPGIHPGDDRGTS